MEAEAKTTDQFVTEGVYTFTEISLIYYKNHCVKLHKNILGPK